MGCMESKKEARVVMFGLDGVGQTSLRMVMETGVAQERPLKLSTLMYDLATVRGPNGWTFSVWDIGGNQKSRALWRNYTEDVRAVIWTVDASSPDSLAESREWLGKALALDGLERTPVCVAANKSDAPGAVGPDRIKEELQLAELCGGRKWTVVATSATAGTGAKEVLTWIASNM
mmetsp:Transcript_52619/g.145763  ORF Transcript_52619/g.145763 Transcript_52619/m.145763 type:complete len:175 (-) Transcript_52619:92-616(-)